MKVFRGTTKKYDLKAKTATSIKRMVYGNSLRLTEHKSLNGFHFPLKG